jgi:hypothetical protein
MPRDGRSVRRETGQERVLQSHYDEGVAIHIEAPSRALGDI